MLKAPYTYIIHELLSKLQCVQVCAAMKLLTSFEKGFKIRHISSGFRLLDVIWLIH